MGRRIRTFSQQTGGMSQVRTRKIRCRKTSLVMEGPITVEKLSSESEKDTVQNVTKSRLSPQNKMSETEFKESEVTRDKALAIDDIIDNFELEYESKVFEDCNKPAELMDEKEQDSEGYIDD